MGCKKMVRTRGSAIGRQKKDKWKKPVEVKKPGLFGMAFGNKISETGAEARAKRLREKARALGR